MPASWQHFVGKGTQEIPHQFVRRRSIDLVRPRVFMHLKPVVLNGGIAKATGVGDVINEEVTLLLFV